jgi:hypothetical protein
MLFGLEIARTPARLQVSHGKTNRRGIPASDTAEPALQVDGHVAQPSNDATQHPSYVQDHGHGRPSDDR